jgi:hypothetical protein
LKKQEIARRDLALGYRARLNQTSTLAEANKLWEEIILFLTFNPDLTELIADPQLIAGRVVTFSTEITNDPTSKH